MPNKEYWLWLIKTQIDEINDHEDPKKIACEFADIISISLEAIGDLGFKTDEILTERLENVESRIMDVIQKYDKLWSEHKKDIKTLPTTFGIL